MPAFNADLGSSVATSYISTALADTYHAGLPSEASWQALTQAEKEAALMSATLALETLTYVGTRCTPASDDPLLEQALQWPRSGATCKGITAVCTLLPAALVGATAQLALSLHNNPISNAPSTPGAGAIQRQQLGELSQSFYEPESSTSKVGASAPLILQLYPFLIDVLGCWSSTNTGAGGRIVLRVRS
jgi:hypothetical protein